MQRLRLLLGMGVIVACLVGAVGCLAGARNLFCCRFCVIVLEENAPTTKLNDMIFTQNDKAAIVEMNFRI